MCKHILKAAWEVGAYFMVDMAHIAGLVAVGVIPSPIPYADFVSSSTTKTFCGSRSGMVFCKKEHAKLLDKGDLSRGLGLHPSPHHGGQVLVLPLHGHGRVQGHHAAPPA